MSNWNSSVPLPTSDSDSSTIVGEDEVLSDIDSNNEGEEGKALKKENKKKSLRR